MDQLQHARETVHHCEYRNPGEAEHAIAVATVALAKEQRTANLIAFAAAFGERDRDLQDRASRARLGLLS
jgi:hypothetical protein